MLGTVSEAAPAPRRVLHADVCVVGAGPAGLTVAHELAGSGLHVLLLEAGPDRPPPQGVDVPGTTSTGLPYPPATTRSAGVGGSGVLWDIPTPAGPSHVRLKELDELDLQDRGVLSTTGWPITRGELEPYYRRARELFGLPPRDGTRDGVVHGHLERRAYAFGSGSVFTAELPSQLRRDPQVTILSGHTVTEVLTAPEGEQVTSLGCRSEADGPVEVQASAYVLAGGGIENARLLLASRSRYAPGLGNHHDQVGRHFMEHPHYMVGVVLPPPGVDLWTPVGAWDVVSRDGHPTQDAFALAPDVLRREGLLNAAYRVQVHVGGQPPGLGHDGRVGQAVVDSSSALRTALRRRDPRAVTAAQLSRLAIAAPELIRYAARRIRPRLPVAAPGPFRSIRVRVMGEQEPSPHSRVRLGGPPDRFGVPGAVLDWRLTDLDVRSMVRGQQLVAHDLGAVLGGRVVTVLGEDGEPRPLGGAHHMGTTRMSSTPRTGVVDPDGRVHGVRNLFVAGSSVFPTGGAANPTLTIVALAVRLARQLRGELTTPAGAQRG